MTSIQQVRLRPGESARSRRLAHEIKRSVGILLAMLLAAPFILGGLLFQVLSGMVSKVMPALPVMFIAAPGAILMALLALVLLTPSILWVWADAVLAMMGNDLP